MSINIAIDGPAGAGKSTIAKDVAKKMNFVYVDTGAMYRTMALYMIENKIDLNEEEHIKNECENIEIKLTYTDGKQHVFLNDRDVSTDIRKEEVGKAASTVAKQMAVRKKLVEIQQKMAESTDLIMDGRDIGTVVLPNADVKIYLTASVEVRAKRRYDELVEKKVACDFEQIKKDIAARDAQDMNRKISPLKQADDAILLDSSQMNIEEVVNAMIKMIQEKINS